MLNYKLLSNGNGVLLTRTPRSVGEKVIFFFDGAQKGDRLVLTRTDDRTIYRTLTEGACEVPASLLYGTVSITVLRSGGNAVPCEPLFLEDIDGVRMLMQALLTEYTSSAESLNPPACMFFICEPTKAGSHIPP